MSPERGRWSSGGRVVYISPANIIDLITESNDLRHVTRVSDASNRRARSLLSDIEP